MKKLTRQIFTIVISKKFGISLDDLENKSASTRKKIIKACYILRMMGLLEMNPPRGYYGISNGYGNLIEALMDFDEFYRRHKKHIR